MTIFIAHAPADREAAEALERFLERRGQFVELDDGAAALRPVQASDVVVLLLSKDFVFAPARLRLEQRALDAWTDERLVVVKLDNGVAPVGLRDLSAIDASFEAQREFKWQGVATAIQGVLSGSPAHDAPHSPAAAPRRRGGHAWLWWIVGLVVLAGLAAVSYINVNQSAVVAEPRFDGVAAWPLWLTLALAGAGGVFALGMLWAAWRALYRPRRARAQASPPAAAAETAPNLVFVSYARANAPDVLPVIEAAKAQGRDFWIDQNSIAAGQGWAGEIVRAIKTAGGVVVMCSNAAFESDHVKREIYLADRYRKKLTPVFIEQAEPPEDFEYFFAGVQQLKLFETPEAERPQAFLSALGAAT